MRMLIQQQYCFTHSAGEDIYLFTLSNAKGTEVIISNFGAIITSYKIKSGAGIWNDIVLGFDKIEDYSTPAYLQQYPWFGAAIGRYANRIKNSRFELNGKQYILSSNQNGEQLHGGLNGFDKKVWQFISQGEQPQAFLELKYTSEEGEEGFPGNLEVIIRFELNEKNELSYEYRAICDQPTPVNLTHHSYFNLNNGEGTIRDHEVKIYASTMLEQDPTLTATGNILPVANTAFDFREFRSIGEGLTHVDEYDRSFVLDNKNPSGNILLVAEARSGKSKTHLQVYSNQPVLHFYSGKWTPVVKGKNGICYGPFSGFCLETHKHTNAVNIPHFPNSILHPGEVYYHKTIYKVSC